MRSSWNDAGRREKIPWIACLERLWSLPRQRVTAVTQGVEMRCQNLGIAMKSPLTIGWCGRMIPQVAGAHPPMGK